MDHHPRGVSVRDATAGLMPLTGPAVPEAAQGTEGLDAREGSRERGFGAHEVHVSHSLSRRSLSHARPRPLFGLPRAAGSATSAITSTRLFPASTNRPPIA